MKNIAIVIFDRVEVLDFAGPFEVFAAVGDWNDANVEKFNVFTVAETADPITAVGGLRVLPNYTYENCPAPDVIIIPGGEGTREQMKNAALIDWVKRHEPNTTFTTSVCTGALVMATAGLLEGVRATTHYEVYDLLEKVAPNTQVIRGVRFIDNGKIITSAGVQAGMDMSLHILARLLGDEIALMTARYIEYEWQP